MEERIKSMRDSYQKFLDAGNAVLAMYKSDGGIQKEDRTQALVAFKKQCDHFLSEFAEAHRFARKIDLRVKVMESAEETEAMERSLENFNHVGKLLASSYQTLVHCFKVIIGQARKLNSEVPGLTEGRGGAHMTGDGNPAASQHGCT